MASGTIKSNFTLLWENPNPSSDFAAQTISLSSSNYKFLMVVFKRWSGGGAISAIAPKGYNIDLLTNSPEPGGARAYARLLTRVSDTSYSAAAAYMATGTTAAAVSNSSVIPIMIYGIN
jgi:hypothetical protein